MTRFFLVSGRIGLHSLCYQKQRLYFPPQIPFPLVILDGHNCIFHVIYSIPLESYKQIRKLLFICINEIWFVYMSAATTIKWQNKCFFISQTLVPNSSDQMSLGSNFSFSTLLLLLFKKLEFLLILAEEPL